MSFDPTMKAMQKLGYEFSKDASGTQVISKTVQLDGRDITISRTFSEAFIKKNGKDIQLMTKLMKETEQRMTTLSTVYNLGGKTQSITYDLAKREITRYTDKGETKAADIKTDIEGRQQKLINKIGSLDKDKEKLSEEDQKRKDILETRLKLVNEFASSYKSSPLWKPVKAEPKGTEKADKGEGPKKAGETGKSEQSSFLDDWLQRPVNNKMETYSYNHDELNKQKPILAFGTYDRFDNIDTNKFKKHGHAKESEFLSNYSPAKITVDGQEYKSVEHYYQASKFDPTGKTFQKIINANSADEARKLARKYEKESLYNAGDTQMANMMKKGLFAKFANPDGTPNALGIQLINTGDRDLIEGNRRESKTNQKPGDDRWGAIFQTGTSEITLQGKNMLGKLLMELRDELKKNA